MHFKYAALVTTLILLSSQPARADGAYDAVDALLAPGPIVTVGEALPPASAEADEVSSIGQTAAGLAVPQAAPYSSPTPLVTAMDQPSAEQSVDSNAAPTAEQHKSKAAWRVDSVPEPSALAMGAVALIFFLFFGRRRRLV